MSCMLSLKTVAKMKKNKKKRKRNKKLDFNISGRCRSLAEEPTENLRLYIKQTSL